MKETCSKSYGGDLLKTRKGRAHGRPLSTKTTMHLVLRSSRAVGKMSFRRNNNGKLVKESLKRFAKKYGIKLVMTAIQGNHIHLHIRLPHRLAYKAFIRAVTARIAMGITGAGKGRSMKEIIGGSFWDRRPFTRVLAQGRRSFQNLNNYLKINIIESMGYSREIARYLVAQKVLE